MDTQRTYNAPEAAPRVPPSSPSEHGYDASNGAGHDVPPTDAFKDAAAKLGEVKEYAGVLVAAKLDAIKLTLRNVAVYAALGIVGGLVGIGVLITAGVLLMTGLAGLIGEIFPEKWEDWGGPLVLGLLVVGGAAVGVVLAIKSITGSSRKRTIEKYENRKRDERFAYGHDVTERAREQVERERAGA
jgi:hypothetical protein